VPQNWARDGFDPVKTVDKNDKARLRDQVLSAIPPVFWEGQFAQSPSELIALTARSEGWDYKLIQAWQTAAERLEDKNWLLALWDWWISHKEAQENFYRNFQMEIFQIVPQQKAEQVILDYLRAETERGAVASSMGLRFLPFLPEPWSPEFALECSAIFQQCFAKVTQISLKTHWRYFREWVYALTDPLAAKLPPACLEEVERAWEKFVLPELPAEGVKDLKYYQEEVLDQQRIFLTTLHLRQRIYKEIN
jgi:hypothetical protein